MPANATCLKVARSVGFHLIFPIPHGFHLDCVQSYPTVLTIFILRMPVLAKSKLPAFMIHGDEDVVVPLKENSSTFAQAYKNAGAEDMVTVIVARGQGHNLWEGFFRCPELVDFVVTRAKAGAE